MDADLCNSLLGEMAAGDLAALEKLYELMQKDVLLFALSITQNLMLAEDVRQETFIKIYRYAGKYSAGTNALGFVFTVTKNTALDMLRHARHEIPGDDSLWTIITNTRENDVVDKLLLKQIIGELKPHERQILLLHLVSGYTHKEIAYLLHLPVTTVQWRYRTALQKASGILNPKEALK